MIAVIIIYAMSLMFVFVATKDDDSLSFADKILFLIAAPLAAPALLADYIKKK